MEKENKINKLKSKIKCQKCGYIWIRRAENPKSCPDCKQRTRIFKKKK